jgi:hypothetical protein
MMILGAADLIYRILLAIGGIFLYKHLSVFYVASGFVGSIICLIWYHVTSYGVHALFSIGKNNSK